MWALLTAGLLGSFHCVGMCGGFVLAVDRSERTASSRIATQVLFHLGKTLTYVFLGAIVGIAGVALVKAPWFSAVQTLLSVLAGLLMIVAGLQFLGVLKELPVGGLFGPDSLYGRAVKSVVNMRGAAAPAAMGMLTGFLPCPLVYAFLAAALEQGSLFRAILVMAILGLASMPALMAVVLGGSAMGPALRRRMVRVAGVWIILLGLVTAIRGAFPEFLHGLFGHGHHHL